MASLMRGVRIASIPLAQGVTTFSPTPPPPPPPPGPPILPIIGILLPILIAAPILVAQPTPPPPAVASPMIVCGIKDPPPLSRILGVLGTLLIITGIVLVLSPLGWVAYTAMAVGPTQTAALAAWERAATPAGPAQNPAAGMGGTIPRLGLRRFVPAGAPPAPLRRFGVGRITWTALPASPGLLGIAGPRTTYGAPFFRLDTLRRGDAIFIDYNGRRFRYAVMGSQVVRPEQMEVLAAPAGVRGIALVTCTPAYSAAYRLVVLGTLRGVSDSPAP